YREESVVGVAEKNNSLVFGLPTDALHWDYLSNSWSIDTLGNMADVTIHDGRLHWVTPSGSVRKESTAFWDGDNPIEMRVRTPWIKVAGLTGLQRIYECAILGEYKSPHTLNVNIYQDYRETPTQTVTVPVTGAAGDPLLVRFGLQRQKCSSISFEIWDSNQ